MRNLISTLILVGLGVAIVATPAAALSEPAPPTESEPMLAVPTATSAAPAEASSAPTKEPFSLYLAQADIRDVLHMIGRHFELNIITTPDVTGEVSVYFTGVDPEEALASIVTANGFAFEKKGSIIEVYRPASEDSEPIEIGPSFVIRVVDLVHADAAEIAATLRGLMPEDLETAETTFQTDARSNSLVVKGLPEDVDGVVELVKSMDRPVPQIRIEVQIMETIMNDSERYGIDWFMRFGATGARRPTTFPFDNSSTGGIFWPENQTVGDDLTFSTATGTTTSSNVPLFPENSAFPFTAVEDFLFGYLDASQLSAVLELIDNETNTRLVSKPEITTLNNKEAVITIGNEVPIPTYTRNDETNVVNISGYEDRYVGTILSVTPRVTEDNLVSMQIRPEISDILEFRGDGVFQIPVTATRSAETNVSLEDGKTLVIGGLVREREITRETKFPFLGDVPGLKYLFSYRSKEVEKSDLMIFITPHIMGRDRMENTGKVEFEGEWLTDMQLAAVSALRGGIASQDAQERRIAVQRLERLTDEMVEKIVKPELLLRRAMAADADPEVRAAAAGGLARRSPDAYLQTLRELERTRDPRAVRTLVQIGLSEPAIHLRLAALEGAAAVDRYATIDLLNREAASGARETAERAALGLWWIGDGSSHPILLFDSDPGDDPYLVGAMMRCFGSQGGAEELERRWPDGAGSAYAAEIRRWVLSRRTLPIARTRLAATLERAETEGEGLELLGSLYERKKIEEALGILDQRARAFGHLVRTFLQEVEIGNGATRLDTDGRLHLSRDDLENWPVFSLSHQLVRYATEAMLDAAGRELCPLDSTALAYRTQYWTVRNLLGIDGEHRRDYTGFMDSVLARAGGLDG